MHGVIATPQVDLTIIEEASMTLLEVNLNATGNKGYLNTEEMVLLHEMLGHWRIKNG